MLTGDIYGQSGQRDHDFNAIDRVQVNIEFFVSTRQGL
jgi:hypothetical protein